MTELSAEGADVRPWGRLPAVLRPVTYALSSGGMVLTYHGIRRTSGPDGSGMHVSAAELAATARAVGAVATFVPLRELVARHRAGKGTRGLAAITFDDAYASVVAEAMPVMQQLSIPITVFVISSAAISGKTFWWDRVDDVFAFAGGKRWSQFESDCRLPNAFRVGQPESLARLANFRQWILAECRGRWPAALEEPLVRLEAEAGHRSTQRALTYDELDAFHTSALVEFGVHTASHPVLPLLRDDDIRDEIRSSYAVLRERYPRTLGALSLPFGLYDARTIRIAKEERIDTCLTLEATLVDDAAAPETIPRIGMTARHRPWQAALWSTGAWRGVQPPRGPIHKYPDLPSTQGVEKPRARPPVIQLGAGSGEPLGGTATAAASAGATKRALFLLEDLGGGTGNHLSRIVELWRTYGWEVVIVTQTQPLVRQLPKGVDIRHMTSAGWLDRFPLAQIRRLFELRRIVKALKPDMVHAYFFWSIIYGRMLKLLGDVKFLVENREDMGFSWHRGSYAALRLTRHVPDRIICVAEAVRQVALRREGADPERTTVVRNGIEMGFLQPAARPASRDSFGFNDDHVVVGMVANLPRAVKGGGRLLDCVGAIVARAPHVRFLLVGLGTDRETLGDELRARGIADFVVGAGYRPDVEPCYAAMDISVLTSSSEGLSITLLESMRHGLPTVVTSVGGNPEVVVEGETGFLVPVGDTPTFVDRVVRLANDAKLRRSMGDAGLRRVAAQFTIEDVSRRYLDVYAELLERERKVTAPAIGVSQEVESNA